MNSIRTWLLALLSAALSAVGTSISLLVVDPATFNFTAAGWSKLGEACLLNALIAVGLYLKQSPLPISSVTVTQTTTATQAVTKE